MLNVSPMGNGQIPPEQLERLKDIADWMSSHCESILDTTPGLEPWQFYGPSTRKGVGASRAGGDRIYLHLLQQFFIKPATKINSKTKPSIGFSTFIRGAFDCDLL